MEFHINNGTGQITLGMSDIGSYLKIADPVAVDWHDCAGSVAHYCCLLAADHSLRETIRQSIVSVLNGDYSGDKKELLELLKPLFGLFKNGRYHIEFYESNRFFNPRFLLPQSTYQLFSSLEILYPQLSDASDEKKVLRKFDHFATNDPQKASLFGIMDYTTSGYYPHDSVETLLATRPENSLDRKQVQFYIDSISEGARPLALLLDGFYQNGSEIDYSTPYYILDGHHKLAAYKELNISPSICRITYYPETKEEIEFDAEMLAERMLPWQVHHLIENWEEKTLYLREKMAHPESPLHRVVRHGDAKDRYPNGQLIEKSHYAYGQIEGEFTRYYNNGKVKTKGEYDDGRLLWQKHWDPNGKRIPFEWQFLNPPPTPSVKPASSHSGNVTPSTGTFKLFWGIVIGILLVILVLFVIQITLAKG